MFLKYASLKEGEKSVELAGLSNSSDNNNNWDNHNDNDNDNDDYNGSLNNNNNNKTSRLFHCYKDCIGARFPCHDFQA